MSSIPSLDPATLRALRSVAQGIGGSAGSASVGAPGTSVADVASRMLAMQAQDAPGVRWSVGVRAPGITDLAVTAALARADVVRTWPMRGTLHLVHAADVRWLLDLTSERMLRAMAARRSALGITAGDCAGTVDVAHLVLAGGIALGRTAFLRALEEHGIATGGQRGYHLLAWLAISGHVVLGSGPDAQPAVLLADEWLPRTRERDRDEALAELAVRYVSGHGPVSVADLARWAGLPVSDVRRGFTVAADLLETILVDGQPQHVAAGSLDSLAGVSSRDGTTPAAFEDGAGEIHLLPGFDEYLLGYADRSFALAPEHAGRAIPGDNGMFRPTVVVDGRVVGTWSRTVRAARVEIAVNAFPDAPKLDGDRLAPAAARYGLFARRPSRVMIAE